MSAQNLDYGLIPSLYKFIATNIKDSIEEIKHIDLFYEQFDRMERGEIDPIITPAVLVEILEFETEEQLPKYQVWEGSFIIHLAVEMNNNTYEGLEIQENNLKHYNLIDRLYKSLSGKSSYTLVGEFKSDHYKFYNVRRTRVRPYVTSPSGRLKILEMQFSYLGEDYSNMPISQTISS